MSVLRWEHVFDNKEFWIGYDMRRGSRAWMASVYSHHLISVNGVPRTVDCATVEEAKLLAEAIYIMEGEENGIRY